MCNKLHAGSKKYLKVATNVTFSVEELKLLKEPLEALWISEDSGDNFDACFHISCAIHECITQGHCYDTYNVDETEGKGITSDTRSVPLTIMQYLLINFKRVFFFIALVPLSNVPLYINDPSLELFARWRLTIAK